MRKKELKCSNCKRNKPKHFAMARVDGTIKPVYMCDKCWKDAWSKNRVSLVTKESLLDNL